MTISSPSAVRLINFDRWHLASYVLYAASLTGLSRLTGLSGLSGLSGPSGLFGLSGLT
jgi:hypothetical protein